MRALELYRNLATLAFGTGQRRQRRTDDTRAVRQDLHLKRLGTEAFIDHFQRQTDPSTAPHRRNRADRFDTNPGLRIDRDAKDGRHPGRRS